ncbi:hypothetical protein J3Q64DRAFT_1678975 [Phycomyces blakesleeanus]|uniref:RhoGAP-domain-containing protein n=1 Tax=Phycomyces blakesleeanus TaxID=4837 RepID=A0ABR3AZB0_PHYBL
MEQNFDSLSRPAAPTCARCHDQLGSQLVKALDEDFHPECFTCLDCNAPVASKFFPFTAENGQTLPLCERDYFGRLGLVCDKCHEPLRAAYTIAMDKKYHTDHFTCSACEVAFGPEDSYYEHNGQVFCHFHYSIQFAVMCAGCEMAILKQYVEIDRKDDVEHWHPECYMIHKYWNVRIAQPSIEDGDIITQKESSAVCISEMLLHVSNGSYIKGICISERFLVHVEALFAGIDELCKIYTDYNQPEFKYTREAKMLCKKIINFFSLMWKTQEAEMRKLGISQELLSLITGLAHYLKILIRVALTAALRLDITIGKPVAVSRLLAKLMEVAGRERHSRDSQRLIRSKEATDCCHVCKLPIEDQCIKYGQFRWHIKCFGCRQCKRPLSDQLESTFFSAASQSVLCSQCSGSKEGGFLFEYVTKLVQYAFLLRVALSRLCSLLQITDQQLSAVDYSSKTKIQAPKDALGKDVVTHTVEKQQVINQYVDEKMLHYPTHIADTNMMSATKLERKMSRSFKTAKRSTMVGNANANANTSKPIQEEAGDSEIPFRTAPTRLDSLVRRLDQQKNLPPLPLGQCSPNSPRSGSQGSLGLSGLPQLATQNMANSLPSINEPSGLPTSPTSFLPGNGNVNGNGPPTPILKGTYHTTPEGKPRKYLSELSALQYMIIRHVAVVHIEPYVREYFTLGELLNMIELKKASIWGKFFTSIRAGGARKPNKGKEEGTFGVSLDVLTERTGVESNLGVGPSPIKIAGFIDDSITAMRQKDMSVEGVFRKNGNIRRLKELTEQLDKHPHDVDLTSENAIQIAALLKKFLRELPDPLLTFKLHGLFTCAQRIENPVARKHVLHLACCMLPRCNRDTFEILCLFLKWTASFSNLSNDAGSRMDIGNLARVIAPNILTTDSKDPTKDDSFSAIRAVEILLETHEDFCLVPEELEPFLEDPTLADGKAIEISSKDFLKKVENMMRYKKPSPNASNAPSIASPSPSLSADLQLFDGPPDIYQSSSTPTYSHQQQQQQQQQQSHMHRYPLSDPYTSPSHQYSHQQSLPPPSLHQHPHSHPHLNSHSHPHPHVKTHEMSNQPALNPTPNYHRSSSMAGKTLVETSPTSLTPNMNRYHRSSSITKNILDETSSPSPYLHSSLSSSQHVQSHHELSS